MLEAFDQAVAGPAKRAADVAAQSARLARQIQRAAANGDLRAIRQRSEAAETRAAEAREAVSRVREAAAAFRLTPDPDGGEPFDQAAYGLAFEQACAALEVPLQGAYPDYQVFPFEVHLRPAEERAVVDRRQTGTLRPEALARLCKAERDRRMKSAFLPERFASALIRAYDLLLPEVQQKHGAAVQHVALVDVFELLQLGSFGRRTYARASFAFDLYRFRLGNMALNGRAVMLGEVRRSVSLGRNSAIEVPTSHGRTDRLNSLQVVAARDGTGEVAGSGEDHA